MPRVKPLPSLSLSQGRRPLLGGARRQKPEPLRCGPQLIPRPHGRGPKGAGRRAGGAPRSSAHLSQPPRAQVKLGVDPAAATPARLTGQEGREVHNTSSGLRAEGSDRAQAAQATDARPPHLTWPFPAPVPATPTGLDGSLRVARSLRPKYREISRSDEDYCGKRFFYHSTETGK